MKIALINIVMCVLFFQACSAPETVIKQRTIEITIPAIKDSLPATYESISVTEAAVLDSIFLTLPDSAAFVGEKEIPIRNNKGKIKGSLKVGVKYFPKEKEFKLDLPEQKVDTSVTDTTKNSIKEKVKLSEKLGYVFIGLVIAAAIYLYIKNKRQ